MAADMHFANLWERISDEFGDHTALIHGENRRTYTEFDDRAARLASALVDAGLKPDSKFGTYLYNSNEYIESQYAGFKMRGVPINVNYRYLEDELVYLLNNADAEALFFHASFADRIATIRNKIPNIKFFVQVNDGSGESLEGAVEYETLITQNDPMKRINRSGADIYMLYTGGTTGMPKGVMYPHEGICAGLLLGYSFRGLPQPETLEEVPAAAKRAHAAGAAPTCIVCCPLMHGTGLWVGAMMTFSLGGTTITLPNLSFDADAIWRDVGTHKATDLVIVGDAFAKPMLKSLDDAQARGEPFDISSVKLIVSSGVMWTQPVKEGLLKHGDMTLADLMGSTEGGMGSQLSSRELQPKTAKFELNENVKVFDEDMKPIKPGSGEMGILATTGNIPLGYYKDPEKTAHTFSTVDGVRYAFPGDYATVEADGTISLLGRGSACINSGGEKIFPEEVEEAIKKHDAVYDCLVVGIPDERFGERVTAVVSFKDGRQASADELIDNSRAHLAGYKLPRSIFPVDEVQRAPNGKADYKWAKQEAADRLGVTLPG
jgi:fatty-acyl-CoA synthase